MVEKASKLIPLEDYILIEPIEEENKTRWGIIMPDTNKEKPSTWKVLAVWAGKILDNGQRWPIDVKVWDIVYFTKYSPDELDVYEWTEKKKYLVIKQSSILAKQG